MSSVMLAAGSGPSRLQILRLAWPIILANAASPLLGLADTAVIGNTGSARDLGAIAIGALVFNFIYWSFGFLRMGTTGFVAQAAGAGNEPEVRASLARALLLSLLIGVGILLLQVPLQGLAFYLLDASPSVEAVARRYVSVRIWGAPAALAIYSMMGTLIGLGLSRHLMWLQLLLNGLNISLDLLLAGGLGLGVSGIAWGTAISEWVTCFAALLVMLRVLRPRHQRAEAFLQWAQILEPTKVVKTLSANRDIMIRTIVLLCGFGLFTRQGAQYGDVVLAANHVLLQFISFSAFFLDGFAHVAETLVGQAIGRKDAVSLKLAVRRSTQLASGSALLLALGIAGGGPLISLLSDQAEVVASALAYRHYAALYVLLSFAAFQLDGVFIGAGRAADMRDAALLSFLVFALAWGVLSGAMGGVAPDLGNAGLWIAFTIYVVARAVALGLRYPRVLALA